MFQSTPGGAWRQAEISLKGEGSDHKRRFDEPCKNACMGIDTASARQVLRAIPGTGIVEMEHHGKDTMCCGCRTVDGMPELGNAVTIARLREAVATGADTLIDLCHTCHWIFVSAARSDPELRRSLRVENFSTYVARAMGIERNDILQQETGGCHA